MRRPMAFILAAYAAGILAGQYLPLLLAALIFIIFSLMFFSIWRNNCIFILLLIALSGLIYIILVNNTEDPLVIREGSDICVEGRITSIERDKYYTRVELKSRCWKDDTKKGHYNRNIIIYIRGDIDSLTERNNLKDYHLLTGMHICLKGRVSVPEGRRNPSTFDYRLYLKTRNIYAIINASAMDIEVLGKGNILFCFLAQLRNEFSSNLDKWMNEDSKALLIGMLFGDKTLLEDELYEAFQRNGTAHILAVSGIHVGIVYACISKLLRNRRSVLLSLAIMLLLFAYAALAQFSPSVIRAVTMIGVHILSQHLYRRYDLLSCGCSTALLMLLVNPYNLFSVGFQLSFTAVFSIAFLLPFINHKTGKRLNKITPVIAIQMGMFPLIAYVFNYFSLAAFFLNLPVIMLAGLIIPLGMLMVFLVSGGSIFGILACVIDIMLKAMIKINILTVDLDMASWNVISPYAFIIIIYYGCLCFISSELFWQYLRQHKYKLIMFIFLIIICFSLIFSGTIGEFDRQREFVFVDVGQGDCIHIQTPSGRNILIDGGGNAGYDIGKRVLLPYLLKNRVKKLDLALITHLHDDHYLGIASLCRLLEVQKIGVCEAYSIKQDKIIEDTGLNSEQIFFLKEGDRIDLEEGIWIDILYPFKGTEREYERLIEKDENDISLIMKVYFRGFSALLAGDLSIKGERHILDRIGSDKHLLQSDLLKIGHHGSKTSTGDRFLDAVKPKIAVIQVGKNNFGHPSPEVIDKLNKNNIMVYRNDEQGAIIVNIENSNVRIKTMIDNN